MKRIFGLLFVVIMCFSLVACGFNEEKIDDALQGRWGHSWYASAIGKECLTVYEFDDGEFKHVTVRGGVAGDVSEGTYEITKDKIIAHHDSYDYEFEYSFEDGEIELVHVGDGTAISEYEKIK